MWIKLLQSKIHRATVTDANLNYTGSVTLDETLIDAAGLIENQQVEIYNLHNGNRFSTYVIKGKRDSGIVCLNGAAARLVHPGDQIIIAAYAYMDRGEAKTFVPKIVHVNEKNQIGVSRNS